MPDLENLKILMLTRRKAVAMTLTILLDLDLYLVINQAWNGLCGFKTAQQARNGDTHL